MKKELFMTKEGSHTFYIPEINEYYHSWFGAIGEAQHVYIDQGLRYKAQEQDQIKIFEMGLGTGLNLLLTCIAAKELNVHIDYYTVEKYPLSEKDVMSLNYRDVLELNQEDQKLFLDIHAKGWERWEPLTDQINLYKCQESLLDLDLSSDIDLVYFGAFAPAVQPELWTLDVFKKIFEAMSDRGVLVTYASRGSVKEVLRDVGFDLKRIEGSPRKHHMLRASKV